MNYSRNIRITLYLFASIIITSFVSAANILDQVLQPFSGINLGATYLQYALFIDAILFIVLFMGIAKASLKNLGEQYTRVGTILGIILGIGMVVLEYQTGFNLSKIAFIPALIFLIVISMLLFNLLKSAFEDNSSAFAITYLIFYGMLTTAFSTVLVWINRAVPILSALLAITTLIAAIMLIVRLVKALKGKETTNSEPGFFSKMFNRDKNKNHTDDDTNTTPGSTTPKSTTPRPPGVLPSPTPRARHSTDPPTDPRKVIPGVRPSPKPIPVIPQEPKKPSIPEEETVLIDLSSKFNKIRSQDGLGACTAFAATSIFEYVLNKQYNQSSIELSPLYLWYKTREDLGKITEDTGPNTCVTVMNNLKLDGVCFEKFWTFEGDSSKKWFQKPSTNADADAILKKIVEFRRVDKKDTDQFVRALQDGHPLNIAIELTPALHMGPINNAMTFYHDPDPKTKSGGGHAVVIVGYHSHYPVKNSTGTSIGVKAFKIRNSWDVTWGENGYIWISAETLKKLLIEDPILIKGKRSDSVSNFDVTGRVVFDTNDKKIKPEKTGYQIFSDNNWPNPIPNNEDPYYVGVMAQVKGQLKGIGEIKVTDQKGRFSFRCSVNPVELEPLTELNKRFKQFNKINFKNLPAGVIVYKRHGDGSADKEWYFHIVHFSYSFGGRGGEGSQNRDNPLSVKCNGNELNHSGVPITFNQNHTNEMNIIIPVFNYDR